MQDLISKRLSTLAPPYQALVDLSGVHDLRADSGLEGHVLLWRMEQGFPADSRQVRSRPYGVPLVVILPSSVGSPGKQDLLKIIRDCRPSVALPPGSFPTAEDIRLLLSEAPVDLPGDVVDYLRWRGVALEADIRHTIRRTLELSQELRSVNALSRSLYLSRRALGRRFLSRGLPVPSHWLQIGRLLRACLSIQSPGVNLAEVAFGLGYPDAFALSNQMMRLAGVRPALVRKRAGWEWLLESWLCKEEALGCLPCLAAPTRVPPFSQQKPKPDSPSARLNRARPTGRRDA